MDRLAERLSAARGHPVIGRTGHTSAYDFRFLNPSTDPNDFAATILSSVRGIGRRLEGGKGPTDVLVIGHVEKPGGELTGSYFWFLISSISISMVTSSPTARPPPSMISFQVML